MKKVKILYNLLFLIGITYTQSINSDSLVAHYKLSRDNYNAEENYFYDLSGNGNHAMPSDTFQFVEDHLGNPDGAMRFDGIKDFLDCGNDKTFNFDKNKTINIWLKTDFDQKNRYAKYTIFNKHANTNLETNFFISFISSYRLLIYSKKSNNVKYASTVPHSYTKNQYHLLTFVINQSEKYIYFYRNSILYDKIDYSDFSLMTNNSSFIIGKRISKPKDYYKGSITEISIVNTIFSVEDIENLFDDIGPHYVDYSFENGIVTETWVDEWNSTLPFSYLESTTKPQSNIYSLDINGKNIKKRPGQYCLEHKCYKGFNRAEISLREYGINRTQTENEHRWYSRHVLIPDNFDWSQENPAWVAINQIADVSHTKDSPILSIHALKNRFHFQARLWSHDSNGEITSQWITGKREVNNIKLETNKWYNIVLHIFAKADSTGYIEGWINNNPVFVKEGNFAYNQLIDNEGANWSDRCKGIYNDGNKKYIYKIRDHKLYGQNIKYDDGRGLLFILGYYRWDNPITQSIYTDDIKIGKTAKSIGFEPNNNSSDNSNLHLSNSTIIFPETPQGEFNKEYVILKNNGGNKISILNIIITDTSNFELIDIPHSSILPGDSLKVEVLFNPLDKTKDNSTMLIYTYDNERDSVSIDLKGKGIYLPKLKINIPNRKE